VGEKLIREDFYRLSGSMDLVSLWKEIESNNEAIREETRAEVLKDHFKIGEIVECGRTFAYPGIVVAMPNDGSGPWMVGDDVRRAPKMRPMNNREKVQSWVRSAVGTVAKDDAEALSFLVHKLIDGETIDGACRQAGISTEVSDDQ